jgi:hypothetical protein
MRYERDFVARRVVFVLELYQLLKVSDFLERIAGFHVAGRYFIGRSSLEPLFVFL